jgi:hypothetical protein
MTALDKFKALISTGMKPNKKGEVVMNMGLSTSSKNITFDPIRVWPINDYHLHWNREPKWWGKPDHPAHPLQVSAKREARRRLRGKR